MNPQERQAKIEEFLLDPQKVIFEMLMDLKDSHEQLKDLDISALELIQGKDGETPQRGIDYFTEAELQEVFDIITPKEGVDYPTPEEIENFINTRIEAVKAGIRVPKDGKNGKDGKRGEKGEQGSPDTPLQILEKIKKLAKNNRIPMSKIKGLDKVAKRVLENTQEIEDLVDKWEEHLRWRTTVNTGGGGGGAGTGSISTITDNGDGTFTHDDGAGGTTTIDMNSAEIYSTVTQTVTSGNEIAVHDDNNGTTTSILETITSIAFNNTTFNLEYTDESGVITYIPFLPAQLEKIKDVFTGVTTGSVTMTGTPEPGTDVDVYLNGQLLTDVADYSISGTTVNILSGTVSTDVIVVKYCISNIVTVGPVKDVYTGNTGTTVALTTAPDATYPIDVFLNGQLMTETADYTIAGTTLTFLTTLVATDVVTVTHYA